MTTFILVAVIGAAIFIFSNMKKNHSHEVFDLCKPILNTWVANNNGMPDSVMYATYKDDALSENNGAHIFVGSFERKSGDSCGFYVEVQGGRIVLSKLYFPVGITSWHRNLSMEAKMSNHTLYDMLNAAESNHHKKYPNWNNK